MLYVFRTAIKEMSGEVCTYASIMGQYQGDLHQLLDK